jgi:hypothetical protein
MTLVESKARGRARITLLDESRSGQVLVIRRDEDRFILTAQEAVEACHAANESVRFSHQFGELLELLAHWIDQNKSRVHRAQIAVRESDLLFLVTQVSEAYDDELMEKLAGLDLDVANRESLSLIKLNVLAIPRATEEAATAFVSGSENDFWTYAKQ